MSIKKSVVLGLLVLASFALLVSLGNWQVRRLAWKTALIEKIDSRIHKEPVPLLKLIGRPKLRDSEFLPITLRGRFLNAYERHFYQIDKQGRPGWHIYTLFEYTMPHKMTLCTNKALVFVNRGFVPKQRKTPASRKAGQTNQMIEITGLLRQRSVKQAWFMPQNDLKKNIWYRRSLRQLRESLPRQMQSCLAPFFIDLQKPQPVGGWPRPSVTRIKLPNNHLGYIITWYGLALALLGVYGFFLYDQLKKTVVDKSPEDKKTEGQAPKGQAEEDEQ